MKKSFKYICCIIVCVFMLLCCVSCDGDTTSQVLYSGLIGALSALFFAVIFSIPTLIGFIVKAWAKSKGKREEGMQNIKRIIEDFMTKHLNKRTIIIALCVILGVAVIASTVALISTIGSEENEYTITFYSNRGIYFTTPYYNDYKEVMHSQYQDNTVYKVETFSGGYPSEPTPPTNAGYVFLGWYKNPECTDKFLFGKDEVNSNINLYAKWGK